MQEQWPEVEGVTVDRVIRLKQGMIQSGIHLEYRLLRGFVTDAMYRLAHHFAVSAMPIDDDSIAQLAKEVVRNVQRATPVITSLSEECVYLATLRNKLVEVRLSPTIVVIDENQFSLLLSLLDLQVRRPIGTFNLLAPKQLGSRQIDHRLSNFINIDEY
jgi:hypothetical protein